MTASHTENVSGEETVQRHSDGRIARGERTRDAIVEAHAGLLREGVLKPTAKVIAERAGVSLRTLWLNFKDLETLLEATTAYWLDADAALRQPIDAGLPLPERIDALLRRSAYAATSTSPPRPARRRWVSRSRPLCNAAATSTSSGRCRTSLRAFGPELAAAGDDRQALTNELYAGVELAGLVQPA